MTPRDILARLEDIFIYLKDPDLTPEGRSALVQEMRSLIEFYVLFSNLEILDAILDVR